MKKGDKYQPLFEHLHRSRREEVTLTFARIESILDCNLPDSACSVRGWWSNRSQGGRQARAWMTAGYRVVELDLDKERVTFRRPTKHKVKYEDGAVVWDGELVKALRWQLGYSQAQLAKALGVRQQIVSEWEQDIYPPSRATSKHLTLVAKQVGFNFTSD